LPQLPHNHCQVCLLPLATTGICGACLAKPPAFDHAVAALQYAFPVNAMIQSLKYQAKLAIASILGKFLLEKINMEMLPDIIIPMPLHSKRLRERGFNQAVEIGRFIAKECGITVATNACTRTRNTAFQTGLAWKDRQSNIRNAFTCKSDVTGKHIAILDDVMTTGATMNELAKVLKQQGAVTACGWVVARALPISNSSDRA